ncbi:hypothetical protein F0U44_20825 [Nocardioides humilatus]|uniref:Uncharacterized protein n=1 Tax=Nocardioides humilatus TaxID=2607660 RepID=A0A5B1L6Y9_9ACTN|nr:hypothetical protein [Nocardioides humilatus]KAA1415437.1 hypothetical protein F0U44_20825 [Nocardioides humilatus]
MTSYRGNLPRYRPGTDHVESWFVRANDAASARSIWLKATVLTRRDGTSLVQAWCSTFDDDRTQAFCTEVPLADATFSANELGTFIDLGVLWLDLGPDQIRTGGALEHDGSRVDWDLTLVRTPGPLGRPLSLLPSDRLVEGRLPSNKLLTPFPSGTCAGRMSLDGVSWDLDGWSGMQGHNWGVAHSPEYAWGQCLFLEDGTAVGMVEAASGRTEIGRRRSPLVSMLVVRHRDQEYRFDRLIDLWRQRPEIVFPQWTLAMRGPHGRAELRMTGRPSRMVCLDYSNPARPTSYCLNSKTAEVELHVEPTREPAFTLRSEHGGALEFLSDQPEPSVTTLSHQEQS